jgi:aldehyde dehydrogenase (NAD+)
MNAAPPESPFRVDSYLPDNRQLIDGKWVPAANGASIEVLDPSLGTPLGSVPAGTAEDAAAAISSASQATAHWADADPSWRARTMHRWAALLADQAQVIAEIEAREVGYAVFGSMHLAEAVAFMAGQADKIYGRTLPTKSVDTFSFTQREPLGVCASIVPWNAPTALMLTSVAPALAAGNSMVVKPSEEAPLACLYLAALALEAGVPPGVLNVLTGYGTEAGHALSGSPDIRHMTFTGSAATGARVARSCGENIVPVHLELGGKTPHIMLPDADLATAIPSIVNNLVRNAGQICYAGTRVVVHESIASTVAEMLVAAMREVTIGPWFTRPDMGPLISLRRKREVLDYVAAARDEGGTVAYGGTAVDVRDAELGNFVAPTLLTDITPSMTVAREEIFGPVLSLLTFRNEAEAVGIANDTPYGLAASIWTADVSAALRMSRRLQCGQIWINSFGNRMAIGAPFGGFKHSGFGRIGSVETVYEYTQAKTVVIDAAVRPAVGRDQQSHSADRGSD